MGYYERREEKNREFVECYAWFMGVVVVGLLAGTVLMGMAWLVRLVAPFFQ